MCARCASQPAATTAPTSIPTPQVAAPSVKPTVVVVQPSAAPSARDEPRSGIDWFDGLSTLALLVLVGTLKATGVGPSGIHPLAFACVAIVGAIAVVAAVIAAVIWGRRVAQRTLHVVLAVGMLGLAFVRVASPPKLGVRVQSTEYGALVTEVADGTMSITGLKAPFVVDDIDGQKIGPGYADFSTVIAKRRPFDALTMRVWVPGQMPQQVKVLVGD